MENKLFYKKEAEVFEQALPLGNGSFGAMVYGRKEKEKLSLNLDTLWSGKKTFFDSDTALEAFKEARELVLKGDVASAEEIYHTKFYNKTCVCFFIIIYILYFFVCGRESVTKRYKLTVSTL